MADAIRIMGIDPGSQSTGIGIVDMEGNRLRPVHWTHLPTQGDHSARLRQIFDAVGQLVRDYMPAEIAVERVFLARNADSALKLGQARAAALCATFALGPPIHEYSARHVKKAIVGAGGAAKEQVQEMVRLLLGIRDNLQADAADALAVAICHAHERGARAAIARAASGT